MTITLKYFASLRETMGRDHDTLEAGSVATAGDCWARVADNSSLPPNLLIAVNMEYADVDHPVKDGDEVAFFPPVTGG